MAQYPGPNIVTFQSIWSMNNRVAFSNTFYYEQTVNSITKQNANNVANVFHNQMNGTIAALLTDQVVAHQTRLRVFAPNSLIEGFSTSVFGGLTEVDNDVIQMPNEVCCCIQRKTGRFGRSNLGRIFISGLASPMCEGDNLSDAGRTAAKGVADTMAIDLSPGGILLHARHWNRKDNQFYALDDATAVLELRSRRDRRLTSQTITFT